MDNGTDTLWIQCPYCDTTIWTQKLPSQFLPHPQVAAEAHEKAAKHIRKHAAQKKYRDTPPPGNILRFS